ncbi:MAG: peroxide stress protein YaaA [Tenacibaculum sp.]
MKVIISPAKSLDFKNQANTDKYSQARFLDYSERLINKLKTLSVTQLSQLMHISANLANLNYQRNQQWQTPFTLKNAKQAVYSFTGEVFRGLDTPSLSKQKISVLQAKVRILSGLYGILKPLDLIQPYRLEMGTKLKVGRADNLYQFWGTVLAESLNEELNSKQLLINLASAEYFRVIPKKSLRVPVLTPVFKDLKNGQYKTIMTYAKKARGLMLRYIIDNDIDSAEQLKGFDVQGYAFSKNLSSESEYVFTR